MISGYRARSKYGALLTTGVLFAAWLLHVCGLTLALNQELSDVYQDWGLSRNTDAHVLLVYASPEQLDVESPQFQELLSLIRDCQPAKIGWYGVRNLPVGIALKDHFPDCVFGLPFAQVQGIRKSHPGSLDLRLGFTDLGLDDSGIQREHNPKLTRDGQSYWSFEAALAKQVTGRDVPGSSFGITYTAGANGLPHLKASRIVNGDTVREMFQNRIVLIGPEPQVNWGFQTPTTIGGQRMSQLELQGNVVNCLLNGNSIRKTGEAATLVLIGVLLFVVSQLYRQLETCWLPRFLASSSLLLVLMGWFSFHFLSWDLPIVSLVAANATLFVSILFQRYVILGKAVDFTAMMQRIHRREENIDDNEDEVWEAIATSVYQMFTPTRMVLMSLDPGKTHLRVVQTINCNHEEIHEQRRDVNRDPFRAAIVEQRPVRAGTRDFFEKDDSPDEVDFLIPLLLGSQQLGFMVMGMTNEALENWKDFDNFLARYAEEVAVIVAERRTIASQRRLNRTLVRRFQTLPEEQTMELLREQERIRQDEICSLANATEAYSSAVAVCDFFGRVVRSNTRMVRYLNNTELVLGTTNCVDLMSAITGRSKPECRKWFRQTMIERKEEQIILPATELRETSVLFVKPVSLAEQANDEILNQGVFLEIVSGKVFEQINDWQEQLTSRICENANQQLASIQKKAKQISGDSENVESLQELFGSMGNTVAEMLDAIGQCRDMTMQRISEKPDDLMPVDGLSLLKAALEKKSNELERAELRLVTQFESDLPLVSANPLLVERAFASLLDLLIKNSLRESEILVSTKAIFNRVVFHMRNQGDGVPIDGFRSSFETRVSQNADTSMEEAVKVDSVLSNDQLDLLDEIKSWISAWDGSLKIRPRADYGLSVELQLATDDCVLVGPKG